MSGTAAKDAVRTGQPLPAPEIDPIAEPHWEGLKSGELRYEYCKPCGHRWLPARGHCPQCLSRDTGWIASTGQAKLVSWITYHVAFNPHFADRLPYVVAIVELAEGPRMLTNIVDLDGEEDLRIDLPVTLQVEWEGATAVARFRIDEKPVN